MKKIITTIFVLFIILPMVLGSPELIISPNTINTDVYYGQNYVSQINLTNIGNETMYNITFSQLPYVYFSNVPEKLEPNQTAQATINIQPVSMDTSTSVIFYKKTTITATPQMYTVYATSTNFNPSFITIRQNDTIRWVNLDVINHTATAIDFSWSYDITQNYSPTRQFQDIGFFNYFDSINNYGAVVNVTTNIVEILSHEILIRLMMAAVWEFIL